MCIKGISGKGAVWSVLSAVAAYALFSFLAALLCLWEVAGEESMAVVYFAVGLLGAFCSGILCRRFLKLKKIWCVLAGLAVYMMVVFLCRDEGAAAVHTWSYAGCGAGAAAALLWGAGKKKERRRSGVKRQKK